MRTFPCASSDTVHGSHSCPSCSRHGTLLRSLVAAPLLSLSLTFVPACPLLSAAWAQEATQKVQMSEPAAQDAPSVQAPASVMVGQEGTHSLSVTVDKTDEKNGSEKDGSGKKGSEKTGAEKAGTAQQADAQSAPAAAAKADAGQPQESAAAKPAPAQTQGQSTAAGTEQTPAKESAGKEAEGFVPSVALVRPLTDETELAAMQISLGLVTFVGEMEPTYPDEDAYAVLPLPHDSILEVYDLNYDGMELTQYDKPVVVREMKGNEAYVVRIPSFAGKPTKEICVTANGNKHCWRPGDDEMYRGFLHWSRTKGMK